MTATVRSPAARAGCCRQRPWRWWRRWAWRPWLVTGGGGEATSEVGTVRSASGAWVRTSDGSEPRALEDGEAVLYGWSVEAGDSPGVTIDLAAGGVLRFDGGATLTFTAAGESGEPGPSVDIAGGRTWFNPTVSESAALVLRTDVITLSSTRNPVALDCTVDCTVEAPAGGVKASAQPGVNVAPATDEALMVTSDGGLVVRTIPQPSAWPRRTWRPTRLPCQRPNPRSPTGSRPARSRPPPMPSTWPSPATARGPRSTPA